MREWLILLLHLGKIEISLLATLSAAAGYLLASAKITAHLFLPTAAVFLLASGSCALNQFQERETDRMMERTRTRPIPSGRVTPAAALQISMVLILSGFMILSFARETLPLILGTFAVLWYNLVYTPLKYKTPFASIPGALIGAIPPILGWVAGGGSLFDPRIWGVALFFLLWQIPHFWLLLLIFSRDYARAGLPSITSLLTKRQIKRILFVWLLGTGVSSLVIPLYGLFNSRFISIALMAAASWLFLNTVIFLRSDLEETSLKSAFSKINVYAVIVVSLLFGDKLLSF